MSSNKKIKNRGGLELSLHFFKQLLKENRVYKMNEFIGVFESINEKKKC